MRRRRCGVCRIGHAEVRRRDRAPRIMLHDYHLYLAAATIRRARTSAVLSHFTHIPWPPSSIWQVIALVYREGIVAGLAANDVVGFTARYADNFLRTAETFLHGAAVDYRSATVTLPDGHVARVRTYPISIDTRRRPGGSRRHHAPCAAPRPSSPTARARSSSVSTAWSRRRTSSRLRCLRDAPPAQPALSRPGHVPRLSVPVAYGPARIRPLRARGAGDDRPHQRPLLECGPPPDPALLRERLRPGARRPRHCRRRARQPPRRRDEPRCQGGGDREPPECRDRPVRDGRRT